MTLQELLSQRDLPTLLHLVSVNSCELPDTLPQAEWERVFRFTGERGSEHIAYYLELAAEKEEQDWFPDPDDFEDEEEYRLVSQHRQEEYDNMIALENADHSRGELAASIASVLLNPDQVKKYLEHAADHTWDLISFLLSDLNHEKHPVTYSRSNNLAAASLQDAGYVLLTKTEAWENDDARMHVTGITMPEDVREAFRSACTASLNISRKVNNLVFNCCLLARSYYETVPLEIVMKLYEQEAREQELPFLSAQSFADIARENAAQFYVVHYHEGTCYITEPFTLDVDEESLEFSFFLSNLETIQEAACDYYIPDSDEFREFTEYGYWPSREPFRQLHSLLTDFYLDEKEMSEAFPRMLAAFGQSDASDYYRRNGYSMDLVEENVKEKMADILSMLQFCATAEDVFDQLEEITCQVRDEFKEKLAQILKKCEGQTNQMPFGYTDAAGEG